MLHTKGPPLGVHIIPIIVAVALVGCRDKTNFDSDEFSKALRENPVETIRSLGTMDPDDIKRMDPEWPMVAALVAERFGEIDVSIRLLNSATRRGSGDYYSMYSAYLAQYLFDKNRYLDAAKVASALLDSDPSASIFYLLLRSNYRMRNDETLLDLYDAHQSLIGDLHRTERNEIRLMRAVSMLREAHAEWRTEFFSLFVEPISPEIHYRAYTFLRQRNEFGNFDDDERAIMRAMSIAADDQPGAALDALPLSVVNGDWEYSGQFADLLGGLFLESRRASEGYNLFTSLPEYEKSEVRSGVGFWTGRLARAAGDYSAAVKAFSIALPLAEGTGRAERIRWYLIDTARLISIDDGIDALISHVTDIESAAYYRDTFDALLSDAIRRRRWNRVPDLIALIERYGDAASKARARFVRSALEATGPAERGAVGSPEANSSASADDLASGVDTQFYFVSEGGPAVVFEPTAEPSSSIESAPRTPERAVFAALLEVQSYEIAYEWFFAYKSALSRRDYELAALAFDAAGLHTKAMRVFDQYLASSVGDERISPRLLELWFPRAYASIINTATARVDIPSSLFYSVVREESYFNPEARSVSGALGLSQLMPATAADMASRLGMEGIDLSRPEDNLEIGAAYLGYCIRLFDSEFLGLVAYNAGLGRVREWVRQFGDLDFPLFLQAIPFAETRHYVRKVTRALWFYLALYGDIASSLELPLVLPAS